MDWQALLLSFELAIGTTAILLPIGICAARALAFRQFIGKGFIEALVSLPLLLPPTVVGFYLLILMGKQSLLGNAFHSLFGHALAFSFEGLLVASVVVNVPFVVQPIQRAFESIPQEVREAASCCGMSSFKVFVRIELPLAWPGIVTGIVLAVAHTLGEFGVVLMVGGSIPGETKTIALAIYDRVQAFDNQSAGIMAATLLVISLFALGITNSLTQRVNRHRG